MNEAFCERPIAKDKAAEVEKKWFDKHSFDKDEDGRFKIGTYKGKLPVEQEQLFENIRANLIDRDVLELPQAVYDPRTFVMCCGGPSLDDHLEEIREKSKDPDYLIVCSNMTADHLRRNGITPHVHFIIDPKKSKQEDVKNATPEIEYWINAACDPAVFKVLEGRGIKPHVFLAQCNCEGRDIETVRQSLRVNESHNMMAIQGGTMAGLRAINLADGRGFRKMEFYGLDASVRTNGKDYRAYAYKKKRGEAIINVECDRCDGAYDTTLVLQKQVNEFIEWRARMPWMEMKLYGDGLMQHYIAHLLASETEKAAALPNYRYTEKYAQAQREMHGHYAKYGRGTPGLVPAVFSLVSQLAKRHGEADVIDYGSGPGRLEEAIKERFWLPDGIHFHPYDPFVEKFSAVPEPAHCVLCMDVLEHVEPECTEAVLDHIQSLTKNVAMFSIGLIPSKKVLPDGTNAHINLRPPEYWLGQIRRRFITAEVQIKDSALLVVAQSIDAVQRTLATRELEEEEA